MKYTIYSILFVVFAFFSVGNTVAYAQLLPSPNSSDTQIVEEAPKDSYGRSTPRGTVQGYLDAMAAEDFEKAFKYFDFYYINKNQRQKKGLETVKTFQKVLDSKGHFKATSLLSDKMIGDIEDKNEPLLDEVGSYTWEGKTFPIYVENAKSKEDSLPIWLFSEQTLKELPVLTEEEIKPLVDKITPEILSQNKVAGVSYSHWGLLILLIPVSLLITWLLGRFILRGIKKICRKIWPTHHFEIIDAFGLPIFLFASAWIFVELTRRSGIPVLARQYVSELPVIVAWIAFILFCWKLLTAYFDIALRKSTQRHDQGKVSALLFFRRAALFVFIAIGFITSLGMLGIDVTAGIAALGIGGIAIALGAQKTIENLVGSITVIFDKPVRVGDYCKIGDVSGTVETIGMRSTRIRTLDRTLVTIPNGQFASDTIENYAFRDKFRYIHTFGVRYETTPDQMRYLLVEMRSILYAHPKIDNDPARVRFVSLDNYQLSIEVFAYILAADNNEFLEVQEDLHLRFMDVVDQAGSDFAFPSQTLYMARDSKPLEEKGKKAEGQVKDWQNKNELQVPRFDDDQIKNLEGKIEYPPVGASIAKKDKK